MKFFCCCCKSKYKAIPDANATTAAGTPDESTSLKAALAAAPVGMAQPVVVTPSANVTPSPSITPTASNP